ncbi:MAG: acetyl-CoA carboxylase biotin carboxyl carrier protein subunit [Flavobacteriaceae bacterium]|nr:acetyl-CoA carboxylase biotin carboxyl carrier protein subunit [Flavobacteriaceae bacterium]
MEPMYKVKVNGTHTFEVQPQEVEALDVVQQSDGRMHIVEKDASITASIPRKNVDSKKYTVVLNGNSYTVSIADSLDLLIEDLGFELGASKHVNEVKAPMPGLILEISVVVGQEVAEDEILLVLEAMKMENVIASPRAGIIKSVQVAAGDAVDKGTVLIEFEA